MRKLSALLVGTVILTAFPIMAEFIDVTGTSGISGVTQSTGAAWGDYDKDGNIDLYVANYDSDDKLYRNNGDGSFTNLTGTAGLGYSGKSVAAAWADFDKDGDIDLFVAADSGADVLYSNNGNATFTDITSAAGIGTAKNSKSASWADYNGDGFVDLFIAVENSADALFKNNGDGTFTDVAYPAGISNLGKAVSSAWGDYDGDGDLDLFIVNLFPAWLLYANNGDGTFSDVSNQARVGKAGYGSSVNWADYDNDGDLDLYITVLGSPNVLFHNNGDGTFSEMVSAGAGNAGFDWGASFADYNMDGYLDIYIAIDGDNFLYQNNGSGGFANVGQAENAAHPDPCISPVWGDYDGDGDLDVFITTHTTGNILYRNNLSSPNSALIISPRDDKGGLNGFGSLARVYPAGTSTLLGTRLIDGGSGFGGQNGYSAHFGISSATGAVDIEILYPGGYKADKTNTPSLGNVVAAGQTLTILPPDVYPPLNRAHLSAVMADAGTIALSWDASALGGTDADSVLIRVSDTHFPAVHDESGTVFQGIYPMGTSVDSFYNAANLKTYYFSIFVRDSSGNWSDAPGTARDSITVFNPGELTLSPGAKNPGLGGRVLRGQNSIPVMQFTLATDKFEDIITDSLFLATWGAVSKIREVVLIWDKNGDGDWNPALDEVLSSSPLFPGDNMKINFYDRIPQNSAHTYLVLVNLDTLTFSPSDTLRFRLETPAIYARGAGSLKPSPTKGTTVESPPLLGKRGSLAIKAGSGKADLGGRIKSGGDAGAFIHFIATADSVEPVKLGLLTVTLTRGDPRVLNDMFLVEDRNQDGKWNPVLDVVVGNGSLLSGNPPRALIQPADLEINENESRGFFILGKTGSFPFYQQDSLRVSLDPMGLSVKGVKSALLLPVSGGPIPSAVLTGYADTLAPPAVSGLKAEGKSKNEILLSWETVRTPDADSIAIRWAGDKFPERPFEGNLWKLISAKLDVQIISGLNPDKQYYFSLFVKDSTGNWSAGAQAAAKTMDIIGPIEFNDPPVFIGLTDTLRGRQNREFNFQIKTADADSGDKLTIAILPLKGNLEWLILEGDELKGKPDNSHVGFYQMKLTVSDGELSDTAIIVIEVKNINDPPKFSKRPDTLIAYEDQEFSFNLEMTDPDNPQEELKVSMPEHAWLQKDNAHKISGTPENTHVGATGLRLVVDDGELADTLNITVIVHNVNDAPEITELVDIKKTGQLWREDDVSSFKIRLRDDDIDDDVSLDTTNLPDFIRSMDKKRNGREFEFSFRVQALQKDTGRHELAIRFRDPDAAEALLRADITIEEVNDMPTAGLQYQLSGGAVRLLFNVKDEDGRLEETLFHYWLREENAGLLYGDVASKPSLDFYPLLDGNYTAGVQAEDTHELRQKDTTQVQFEIKNISSLALDSGLWVMKSILQEKYNLSDAGGTLHIAKWQDNASSHRLYSRYLTEDNLTSLTRGEGYWFLPDKAISLKGEPDTSNLIAFKQNLIHGDLGWNQVGNPFPYRINVEHLDLTFWKWDPLSADVEKTVVLEPRGAYWVQVPEPMAITLKPVPFFSDKALAKAPAAKNTLLSWSGRLSLEAGQYSDKANLFGVRTETRQNRKNQSEPPKMGRHISLFFVQKNNAGTQRLTSDFRTNISPEGEWWEFGILNAGTGVPTAALSVEGLPFIREQGFKAYLLKQGSPVELTSDGPLTIPLTGTESYHQLIISDNPDFMASLTAGFQLYQNTPNPVKSSTSVKFSLPWQFSQSGQKMISHYQTRILLRNIKGKTLDNLFNGRISPGIHTIQWTPAKGLQNGTYLYTIEAGHFKISKKMVILR